MKHLRIDAMSGFVLKQESNNAVAKHQGDE